MRPYLRVLCPKSARTPCWITIIVAHFVQKVNAFMAFYSKNQPKITLYIALYFYAATPVIAKKPIKSREIFEKSVDFDCEVRYTEKQLSKLWRTTSALR